MIPSTIVVYSAQGELRVDVKTGAVLAIKERELGSYIRGVTRFETGDWLRSLAKSQIQQSNFARRGNRVDILDISYWTRDGKYTMHFRERYAHIERLQSRIHQPISKPLNA